MIVKTSPFALIAGFALCSVALGCPADDTGDDGDDGGNADATAGDDGTMTAGDDGMDDGTPTAGDDGMDDDGMPDGDSGGPATCPGAGGAAADGEGCVANSDCMSGVCELFSDAPVTEGAVCAAQPADCSTRVTATVFDFEAGSRVSGANVRIAQALQAATAPTTAMGIVEGTTDADGQFDQTSAMAIMSQIGIVALVEGDGFFLTATGVASPDDAGAYAVGNAIHDIWAVPTASLTTWSDALAMDAAIPAEALPLGENGGVIGLVRDGTSGEAIDRAEVSSDGDDSAAIVRYLADDGSWTEDGTGAAGIFVIINPSLAEEFSVQVDGNTVAGGTAGSANGAIFTLIMNADV